MCPHKPGQVVWGKAYVPALHVVHMSALVHVVQPEPHAKKINRSIGYGNSYLTSSTNIEYNYSLFVYGYDKSMLLIC